ncbi:MAG: Ca-activated chloride channel [Acidobacteriota bacterium]|nr:Ca-activated chloride channel [Acidobacteriota bacterium]
MLFAPVALRAQSGRQRPAPAASPTPAAQRPRRAAPAHETEDAPGQPTTPGAPSRTGNAQTQQGSSSSAPPSAATQTPPNSPTEVDEDEVYKVDSNLVPVSANVTDATGRVVADLKLEDFELRVDGQPKPISDLSHAETPVRIALLFDNSSSIRPTRELEKQAAINFFRMVIRPVDQAAIFSISTIPTLDQPLTNEVPRLVRTIERYGEVEGSTALFDTIVMAADYLRPQPGRKVMIIVSDGVETTSTLQDFGEMVRRVLASDCQVFVIQTGLSENANIRDLVAERRMQDLTAYTGGFVNVPKLPSDLELAFTQIAADLSQQYVLSYYPNDDARDGRFRVITLRVKSRPNVRVRARRGYYPRRHENLSSLAPGDASTDTSAPYAIRDPIVTMPLPNASPREAASGAREVASSASTRAPNIANAPTHGSKNLDPDADETPPASSANARPTVRLGTFNPSQSSTVEPPAQNSHDSPPKNEAASAPNEAARTPSPLTTPRTENNQPNPTQSASLTSTNDTASPAPAQTPKATDETQPSAAGDSNTKEARRPRQATGAQSSSTQNSPPPNSTTPSTSQASPQASSPAPAQSSNTQAGEPPKKLVVSGGVLNSRAKTLPVPLYPETARRMRVGGLVMVEVTVDESGKVVEARAASGPVLLRPAAVAAARQARFPPTLVEGQPVRVTGVINYTFTL